MPVSAEEFYARIRAAIDELLPTYGITDPGVGMRLALEAVARFQDPSRPVDPELADLYPLLVEASDRVIAEVDNAASRRAGIEPKRH